MDYIYVLIITVIVITSYSIHYTKLYEAFYKIIIVGSIFELGVIRNVHQGVVLMNNLRIFIFLIVLAIITGVNAENTMYVNNT